MATKRKKVIVTMEQKLQALFRIGAGESQTKIANDLGVGKQTFRQQKHVEKKMKLQTIGSNVISNRSQIE
ncbi:hypothetical protein PR048_000956 [Dryococelus australis]|uniref:HTH psq-type domain-containing protein n=1 Tax=Dryococelus australis TaxID=614101 RepID=A0ABQ9IG14_9NEOP|nr:hypothetical protein PR048_000956 [Dryococelus australis]